MHIFTEIEKKFLKNPDKFNSNYRKKLNHIIKRKIQLMVADFKFFINNFDEEKFSLSTRSNVHFEIDSLRLLLNKKEVIEKFPDNKTLWRRIKAPSSLSFK